jgi:hypothetical protein
MYVLKSRNSVSRVSWDNDSPDLIANLSRVRHYITYTNISSPVFIRGSFLCPLSADAGPLANPHPMDTSKFLN